MFSRRRSWFWSPCSRSRSRYLSKWTWKQGVEQLDKLMIINHDWCIDCFVFIPDSWTWKPIAAFPASALFCFCFCFLLLKNFLVWAMRACTSIILCFCQDRQSKFGLQGSGSYSLRRRIALLLYWIALQIFLAISWWCKCIQYLAKPRLSGCFGRSVGRLSNLFNDKLRPSRWTRLAC